MTWIPAWLQQQKRLDNRKDERDWATRNSGRTQPNSGRNWYAKGDTKDATLLSDTKETERKSYTIRKSDWKLLTKWAVSNHRTPCLKIKFVEAGHTSVELAVVPAEFLEAILRYGQE